MDPERWRHVNELFLAALEFDAGDRTAFLQDKCGDDEALRAEVLSLIAHNTSLDDGFLAPAVINVKQLQRGDSVTALGVDSAGDTAVFYSKDEHPSQPTSIEFTDGRRFGDYELLAEIARGGMGVVYKARQTTLDRIVALKMIRSGELAGEDEVKRFQIEAEAAAQLDHPNIVPVYEVGEQNGLHFFSMGFVEGESLHDKLRDGPLTPKLAAELIRQTAEAVQYAHEQGVVHRDLKPANVLVAANGQPRVTDFGLAKRSQADSGMTETGQVMGTPSYMPPEQAAGKVGEVGPLADVYSLGAILYCLLTGRPPFQGSSVMETLKQVLEREPVSVRALNPAVPVDLETICLKCLQKEPGQRYASAAELADDVRRYRDREPITARPVGTIERTRRWVLRHPARASALALVAVVAIGSLFAALYFNRINTDLNDALVAKGDALVAKDNALAEEAKQSNLHKREAAAHWSSLYAARTNLSMNESETGNHDRARELLELCRRPPPNQPDLRHFEWNYLWRLTHDELRSLGTSKDSTAGVTFHPRGRWLAAACLDETVKVWDAHAGRLVCKLSVHRNPFVDAAFSPDGRLLAAASHRIVAIWDVETWKRIHLLRGPMFRLFSLAWSPDGQRIVAGGEDRKAWVWNVSNGKQIHLLNGHTDTIRGIACSPNGRWAASAGEDHDVRIWDLDTGKTVHILKGHESWVACVHFSPDSGLLATGGADRTIRLWDCRSGRLLRTLRGHRHWVRSVRFHPDGRTLASASADQTIRIWNPANGRELYSLKGFGSSCNHVDFSPDGRRLAVSVYNRPITIRDATRPQESQVLNEHTGRVTSLAISRDRTMIATCGDNFRVLIWDAAKGSLIHECKPHSAGIACVDFSPDGRIVVAGSYVRDKRGNFKVGELRIWNTIDGSLVHSIRTHSSFISVVDFHPDGKTLATISTDGTAKIWDTRTWKVLHTLTDQQKSLGRGKFSTNGRWLAVVGQDHVVKIYATADWKVVHTLKHSNYLSAIAFNPDDTILATAGNDHTIHLWNTVSWKETRTLRGHVAPVRSLEFSSDGIRLASGDTEGLIKLWDPATAAEVATFHGHNDWVTGLAFGVDDLSLVSSSSDTTVRIWNGMRADSASIEIQRQQFRRTPFRWHLDEWKRCRKENNTPAAAFHLRRALQRFPILLP